MPTRRRARAARPYGETSRTTRSCGRTLGGHIYEKEGDNAGVSGFIRHYPEQDISVVMLSNMETGVWEPVSKIHGLVVSGEIG